MRALATTSLAVLLAAVAVTAAPAEAAKKFTYRYKVTEVVIRGFFKANVDDGAGNTLTAEETVDVFAQTRDEKCPGKCPLLRGGGLTLRHPPTARHPIGLLQTTPFKRTYVINATETNGSGEKFDCGRTFSDTDRFSALVSVGRGGRRVGVRWNFPTAPINCRHVGGSQSVDLKQMNEFQAEQLYGEVYRIAGFRRRRVTLEIDSEWEWKPDAFTRLRGALHGVVTLRRRPR